MNIWLITKYASSIEEGFESRPFALAREFAQKGHCCSIISSDSNHFGFYPKYKSIYNFHGSFNLFVLRIRTFKYKKTASLRRIISWIDFEMKLLFAPLNKFPRPDIIIVSSLSLLTILNGLRIRRLFGAKLIFEIRDIWPLTMSAEGGYSKCHPFVLFLSWVEKRGYENSDLVVGTMPNLSKHVSKRLGVLKTRCECVPFGFDPDFFFMNTSNSSRFRMAHNLPSGKFIVGYAGSIGLSNGLDAMIDCLVNIQSDHRFLFLFLGEGACRSEYVERTKHLSHVIFLPKVKREEVSSFLSLCDLLYFSSLKSEVWEYGWSPNKLIDYMMAGKPILASYSGFKSMINEAESGFFIEAENPKEINEALNRIIDIPKQELEEMGSKGRSWLIKNRKWQVLAEQYLSLMKEIH
jgi:glycosyltransferase involved in cell wall biosynthesis